MTVLRYATAIVLLSLGSWLALVNARRFLGQVVGKHVASVLPLVPGSALFVGGLLFPDPTVQSYAWIGFFVDFGSAPYLTMALVAVWRESRRYAVKNKLLGLSYETATMKGGVSVFPENECIFEFAAHDKLSSGSYVMRVSRFDGDSVLEISLENIALMLEKREGTWTTVSERGWDDPRMSLEDARLSEEPLTTKAAR